MLNCSQPCLAFYSIIPHSFYSIPPHSHFINSYAIDLNICFSFKIPGSMMSSGYCLYGVPHVSSLCPTSMPWSHYAKLPLGVKDYVCWDVLKPLP